MIAIDSDSATLLHYNKLMIPIILAGGHGTRLWPLSNAFQRKPFYMFFKQSFLEMSLERLDSFLSPLIITSESMRTQIKETTNNCTKIIYEPEPKNTAPAIALACHLLEKRNQHKEIVGIFPVDHYFHPKEKFYKLISIGEKLAQSENQIVTLGLSPKKPLSGYGYIKTKKLHYKENNIRVWKSDSFEEKPNTKKAQHLIKEGNCFWNSGIFISSVDLLIKYFRKYLPELWKTIESIPENLKDIHHYYKDIEAISFDKGIMENINEYLVLNTDLQWRDLGSWDDIADLHEQQQLKLFKECSVISKDSHGNFIFSQEDEPIGLIGIKNSLVVRGTEGLFIAKRGKAQEIKKIIRHLKKSQNDNIENKKLTVLKPWGYYETLYSSAVFKIKLLCINPGHQLSYQSHSKRREHWTVVSGKGEVMLNGKMQKIKEEDYILIPKGQKHRLKNIGEKELIVLEAQFGNPCIEEDIIRYEDDYNR